MWLSAFVLLVSVVGSRASAAPQVSIKATLPYSGYSASFNFCSSGFAEDELTLTISDHGKLIANHDFCSSYGLGKHLPVARVVTDKSGEMFVLLEYAEGHGSSQAIVDYLELDRLYPNFQEVLRVPLSWATSVTQRFTYSYTIELPPSGGIRIHLKGQNIGQPDPDPSMDCCVPDTHNLNIDVGP